jgi:VIT1/CCC1 family predicted Fe2+/Mn2+ transporter
MILRLPLPGVRSGNERVSGPDDLHRSNRSGWLRAAVLGADDGIVSVASLMLGVAASAASGSAVLLAGLAGLVAGAMSMAAGEYVSVSSQRDAELADSAREAWELKTHPAEELGELAALYVERGLDPVLAHEVAEQLSARNALEAHLRDELGIRQESRARPLQAAAVSALSFAIGGGLPLAVASVTAAGIRLATIAVSTLLFLAALGSVGAMLGGASQRHGAVRVLVGGAAAMLITAVIGRLAGVAGL